MTYTVHDTPRTVARIESDLQRVVDAVRQADPGLRALVLTGAFARGEGATVGNAPQNDFDFVAVRAPGAPRVSYAALQKRLEKELHIHVDLAPVGAWRLPWVRPSIFWYDTRANGRVLWGDQALMNRVPQRTVDEIDRAEGMRLLSNRAAGLLLVNPKRHPNQGRLQAAKALMAALDARLLADGHFAPTQRQRWDKFQSLHPEESGPGSWFAWAYAYKTRPTKAPRRDAKKAWDAASAAVLEATPFALRRAGLADLEAYATYDSWVDSALYASRARSVKGARTFMRHPTGRLRVATLLALEDRVLGARRRGRARFSSFFHGGRAPRRALKVLRSAARP